MEYHEIMQPRLKVFAHTNNYKSNKDQMGCGLGGGSKLKKPRCKREPIKKRVAADFGARGAGTNSAQKVNTTQ